MEVRLFSDNTPKIDGISADVTLDIEMMTADMGEIQWLIEDLLRSAFDLEMYDEERIADDIVKSILGDYELVRR